MISYFSFSKFLVSCSLIILFLIFKTGNAFSSNICDNLAGLEADPNKSSKSIEFKNLEPNLIIKHCTNSIINYVEFKNVPKFYLQRARGFFKIGKIKNGMADLNKSYELGYPAAAYALATIYYLGDDVKQDLVLAEKLYKESYDAGVIWAAKGLYFLYSDPRFINNSSLASKWNKIFSNSLIK